MSSPMLSPKQKAFLKSDLRRINLLYGSVRSGKTWISLLKWAIWIGGQPINQEFLMVGKTVTSLKRNCLGLLETLIGDNIKYSISQKKALIFGRTVWLEGANDARSESKIRGMTLKGVYADELTQIPRDFYMMALSRLSVSGAVFLATTNPDHPNHYVKTDIIDNDAIDKQVVKFLLDDNIYIDDEYKDNLKKEYTGVFYSRFILGEFVRAEGIIYKTYTDSPNRYTVTADDLPKDKKGKYVFDRINIGVDFGGNSSAHAMVATAFADGYQHVYVLAARRIDASGVTVDGLVNQIIDFATDINKRYGDIHCIYPDSAEQTIINTLRSKCPYRVWQSRKYPINDRIRCAEVLFATDRLALVKGETAALDNALKNAVWDAKSINKDVRLDDGTSDIDTLDAFEYSYEREMFKLVKYQKAEEETD